MIRSFVFRSLVLIAAFALAACTSPATPQLIGSYPQGGQGEAHELPPISDYSPVPPRLVIVYNASMELEVEQPTYAVYDVRSIAEQNGGYLLNSRTWRKGWDEYAEATIAVPVSSFEAARSRLRSLGEVRSESVSGEIRDIDPGWYDRSSGFSNITVSLYPASANWLRRIGSFFAGVFWIAAAVTQPVLMLIGLFTVIRAVVGWIRKRRRGNGGNEGNEGKKGNEGN